MLKATIVYKGSKPHKRHIDELTALIPLDITWIPYKGKIVAQGTIALDWAWLKTLYTEKSDIQCFLLAPKDLTNANIKSHIGLYNLDTDGIHDFYISLPRRLDDRARLNGFKSNFAWIFTHELLHGLVWNKTKLYALADGEVHAGEKQGKLKEMLTTYIAEQKQLEELQTKLTWLQKLLASLTPSKSTTPTKLTPLVERQALKIIESMEMLGDPVRLVEGFRSVAKQNELYAQGRTAPGSIVTNAKGGESYHNYGVAVDFVFRKAGYNATDVQWKTLGAIGKQYGFEWGGDWKGFVDKPHFEMTLGYSLKDFQQGKVDYSKYK